MKPNKPTLLLDENRARRNLDAMVAKAHRCDIRFRPHFKTHQSIAIGDWFRDAGVTAITVSNLDMAGAFAAAGWRDILHAVPANPKAAWEISSLASAVDLAVLVDDRDAAGALHDGLSDRVGLWVKIDVGYGRAGIRFDRPEAIVAVARQIREMPRFDVRGILTHAGHAYMARSPGEVLAIHETTLSRMGEVKDALQDAGISPVSVSVGDTPTCMTATAFPGADEIRPGNFIFLDAMQQAIGVCVGCQIAMAVACPVLKVDRTRRRLLLHGGAVHLSKDTVKMPDGQSAYGYLAKCPSDGLGEPDMEAPVIELSQEHGIALAAETHLSSLRPGDRVNVFPAHACLASDNFTSYVTLDGQVLPRIPRA